MPPKLLLKPHEPVHVHVYVHEHEHEHEHGPDPADKISRRYACEPTLLTRLRADLPTDTTLSLAPYCHRTDKILCRYAYGTDYALAPYCYTTTT
jgi:hypothetical protein